MAATNHREHVNTRTRMCLRVTVNTEVALLKEEFDVGKWLISTCRELDKTMDTRLVSVC